MAISNVYHALATAMNTEAGRAHHAAHVKNNLRFYQSTCAVVPHVMTWWQIACVYNVMRCCQLACMYHALATATGAEAGRAHHAAHVKNNLRKAGLGVLCGVMIWWQRACMYHALTCGSSLLLL